MRYWDCYRCGGQIPFDGKIKVVDGQVYHPSCQAKSPADLAQPGALAERISSVVRSLPDYNEIDQVANDVANGIDWNELRYAGIYTDGFIAGALWMKNKIKQ